MSLRLVLAKNVARRSATTMARGASTGVVRMASTRANSSGSKSGNAGKAFGMGAIAVGVLGFASAFADAKHSAGDYDAVRADIVELLDDNDYDDGSWGPTLIRLAWHASGVRTPSFDG
jgi:cytochrome c peroxidase